MPEPGIELAIPDAIEKMGEDWFTIPLRVSGDYLKAMLGEGLKVETGTWVQLSDTPGVGLTLLFTPVIPLLICRECGFVGDTSEQASWVDDVTGEWRSAFQEGVFLTRCQNPECLRHGKLFTVARSTVYKNALRGQRPREEF